MIAEKVEFSALRIAVVDEQHRFGVIQRGRFNSKVRLLLVPRGIYRPLRTPRLSFPIPSVQIRNRKEKEGEDFLALKYYINASKINASLCIIYLIWRNFVYPCGMH